EVGYRRLREALARYRAVAAAGGWPAIPDGGGAGGGGAPPPGGDRGARVGGGGVHAPCGRPRGSSEGATPAAPSRGRPRRRGSGAGRGPLRRGARASARELSAAPRPDGRWGGEHRDSRRAQRARGTSRGAVGAEPRALALAA